MRKITFYCDRCGKMIPDKSIMHQLMTKLVDVLDVCTSGFAEEEEEEEGAELCADCYKEIDGMVAFMVENPTIHFDGGKQIVPKDPKKQNNRKKLDIGKIGALLRAGWSMAKIADEMGVSAQTIANHKEEALALLAKQDLAEELENDIQEV